MKKCLAAAMALCLLLSACGGGEEREADVLPEQLAWAVWESQGETPESLYTLTPADAGFEDSLTAYYQLSPEDVKDGFICYAGGMDAFEIAILRMGEQTDMAGAESALLAYRESRAGDFTGYLPEQAALAEQGLAVVQGQWAALLLCPEPEEAQAAFLTCLGPGAPSPETPRWPPAPETAPEEFAEGKPVPGEAVSGDAPPKQGREEGAPPSTGKSDAAQDAPGPLDYDGGAVLAAWKSGGSGGLSEKSRAVLEAARQVIEEVITAEMSGYDRELAIHDWMLAHGQYDRDALSRFLEESASPDSETPYGFLLQGKGVCRGYASTFQLFMDLLEIECVTVEGTAHNGTADHAWNLVRLDGEWYGVDVTWDDPAVTIPVPEQTAHRYFNVTSEFLRDNDHQWDAAVPEAEGTAWAWQGP